MPTTVRANNFTEEVLRSAGFVLVDVYGEQCMPCKLLSPILMELSREYELKLCMLNVDREPHETQAEYEEKFNMLAHFQVMNLPTMLLFRDGQLATSLIGLHTKEELLKAFGKLGLRRRER